MDRWRDRRLAGLAMAALIGIALGGVGAGFRADPQRWIVVRNDAGVELARAPLPADGTFAMRYRNSLYGSLVEERFRVAGDVLRVEVVAADEVAVLEEYYAVTGRPHEAPGPRRFAAKHTAAPIELPLRVQATRLGERTLLAGKSEVTLWRLPAPGERTVMVLSIEGSR